MKSTKIKFPPKPNLPRVADIPATGFLIEIPAGSQPDGLGRQQFVTYWRDADHPWGLRGQVSRAVIKDKTEAWDAQGVKWLTRGDSQ